MRGTAKGQDIAGKFVQENVLECVTSLISDMYRAAIDGVEGFRDYEEELHQVSETIDYEEMAVDKGIINSPQYDSWYAIADEEEYDSYEDLFERRIRPLMDEDDLEAAFPEGVPTHLSPEVVNELLQDVESLDYDTDTNRAGKIVVVDTLESWDSAEDWYSDVGWKLEVDDYRRESLEFWTVSDHLAYHLKRFGEPVEEIYGMNVWGRGTSGQAICIDYVIEEICEALGKFKETKEDE